MGKKRDNKAGALNDKQRRFAEEYLVDCNATQAAIRAGYAKASAHVQGARLLKDDKVRNLIEAGRQRLAAKTEISAERVLNELAVVGFADMRHYLKFTEDGNALLDWSAMPPEATKAIAEITQEEYLEGHGDDARPVKRTKFKLHSKLAALESIARHLGMFIERVENRNENEHRVHIVLEDLNGNQRHVNSLREFFALSAIPAAADRAAGGDVARPEQEQARNGRAPRR